MRKDSNIIIRVESSLKDSVMKLVEKNGYTLSDVLIAFLKDIEKKQIIPINLNRFLPHENSLKMKLNIKQIKTCLEEIIYKMEYKNKIEKIYLFGSYARGEEKLSSDIDLRIETNSPLGLIKIGALRQTLVEKLGKDVDIIVSKPEELDKDFYFNIKRDEICIYEK